MAEKNLYFYVIEVNEKITDQCDYFDENDIEYYRYPKSDASENDKSQWIFVESNAPSGKPTRIDIQITIKAVKSTLEMILQENSKEFKNIYFGIHGKDWHIKSEDYNSKEAFFPEEFDHLNNYATEIKATEKFKNAIKMKYGFEQCIIKVFSHLDISTIYDKYTNDPSFFLSDKGQKKIFFCTAPLLATLLHSFRVIISSLDIANNDPNHQPEEIILNDLKMLLNEIVEGRTEDSPVGVAPGFLDYLPDRNHPPDDFEKVRGYLKDGNKDLREFIEDCIRIEIEMTKIMGNW